MEQPVSAGSPEIKDLAHILLVSDYAGRAPLARARMLLHGPRYHPVHPGKHQHGASVNWTAQTYNVSHRQESNPASFIQPSQGRS